MLFESVVTTLDVRPNDLDSLGHVNNATILEYFEAGRWEWIRDNGLRLSGQIIAIVSRIEVDYRRMILPGRLEVHTDLEQTPEPNGTNYRIVFLQKIVPISTSESQDHKITAARACVQVCFWDTGAQHLATAQQFLHSRMAANGELRHDR